MKQYRVLAASIHINRVTLKKDDIVDESRIPKDHIADLVEGQAIEEYVPPVEETPVEETPVEETPVEETPTQKGKTKVKTATP